MRLPVFQSPHGQFAAIVVAYCVLYFVLRLILSPVLGTDDVEQAVCAQSLALGCDLRQPPLYTWLQWLTNQLAGEGLLAIFLLKYGLLALLYWLLYRIGLRLFADTATAGIAALSLWLAYPFAVGVHQGVTHSLLLSVLLAASFLTALRLEARRSLGGYLLLGLLLGLGMLAKYSFALYAAGLVLAALSLPRYQVLLLDARALATLLAALLVVTPHGLWAWERLDAMHGALGGLGQLNAPAAYWPRVAGGLASLASALLQFLFPLWLIVLIFYPRAFRPLPAPLPDAGRGMGLTEAARGSLGHWVVVQQGRIANYQIVAPTSWNFAPRDAAGVPGALEQALVGAPVRAAEDTPVAVQHVVRSFDPCMVCTVH